MRRLFGTIVDISKRKQSELDLKHAVKRSRANQAKDDFLRNDFTRDPHALNAIIGLSSFLSETEMDAEQQDLVETIH